MHALLKASRGRASSKLGVLRIVQEAFRVLLVHGSEHLGEGLDVPGAREERVQVSRERLAVGVQLTVRLHASAIVEDVACQVPLTQAPQTHRSGGIHGGLDEALMREGQTALVAVLRQVLFELSLVSRGLVDQANLCLRLVPRRNQIRLHALPQCRLVSELVFTPIGLGAVTSATVSPSEFHDRGVAAVAPFYQYTAMPSLPVANRLSLHRVPVRKGVHARSRWEIGRTLLRLQSTEHLLAEEQPRWSMLLAEPPRKTRRILGPTNKHPAGRNKCSARAFRHILGARQRDAVCCLP
mmetsp:Transcript_101321/g.290706  ORF Transcript_101321/g.290706 Transcript_101321/m.290706 type:complete len:296 (+) Transcript_101321:1-888(+)